MPVLPRPDRPSFGILPELEPSIILAPCYLVGSIQHAYHLGAEWGYVLGNASAKLVGPGHEEEVSLQ